MSTARYVADESWTKQPPNTLVSTGYSGVIGYCSRDRTGKNLTAPVIQGYLAAGLVVGLVWEGRGQAASNGGDAGQADANDLVAQAHALGATGGCLFMAAEDPTPQPESFWPKMDAYFGTAGPIVREAGFQIGGYGSEAYLNHAKSQGLIDREWLVGGWSQNVAGDLIQQSNNPGLSTLGGAVDCNYVVVDGDWGWVTFAAATITTPPVDAAQTDQQYTVMAGDTLSSVAERFDTTVADIADANNIINPADFKAGLVITIPHGS